MEGLDLIRAMQYIYFKTKTDKPAEQVPVLRGFVADPWTPHWKQSPPTSTSLCACSITSET